MGEIVVEWMESDRSPLQPVVSVMDNARCHGGVVEECIVRNGFRYLKQYLAVQDQPHRTFL